MACRLLHHELLAVLDEDALGGGLHTLAAEVVDGGIVVVVLSLGVESADGCGLRILVREVTGDCKSPQTSSRAGNHGAKIRRKSDTAKLFPLFLSCFAKKA